jgi:hypothetical protein
VAKVERIKLAPDPTLLRCSGALTFDPRINDGLS